MNRRTLTYKVDGTCIVVFKHVILNVTFNVFKYVESVMHIVHHFS